MVPPNENDDEAADEETPLLTLPPQIKRLAKHEQADNILDHEIAEREKGLTTSTVGERLAYETYTTIDWLHDLVKDSYRYRRLHAGHSIRSRVRVAFDSASGWIAVMIVGALTACIAFLVDVAEASVSDWKFGYCKSNPVLNYEACCKGITPANTTPRLFAAKETCADWKAWSGDWWKSFGIYGGFALTFGLISALLTMLTKRALPAAAPGTGDEIRRPSDQTSVKTIGKSMYMAAGSGIPELKTVLAGFVIPHLFDVKVLVVKAVGAVFAVASGMCLGKEGPFVHISGCVGYLVLTCFPKYRDSGRRLRELLAASVAAGLSVAFGAPIGGVLFSYEEISTYFPRPTLWRAFLCSMFAAVILKLLNPTGTGKLVLFETNYGTIYEPYHYLVFVLLGVVGGIWGGLFCMLNFQWGKWFRSFTVIRQWPFIEVLLVVLATTLLQYPNPLTRDGGDKSIKNLLVNCSDETETSSSFVCQSEAPKVDNRGPYVGWLVYGCLVKLVLTTITFGAKVPSGIIIPALEAGSFFGRLVGQAIPDISPGIFAMVGSGAFLAGVSRMTISLCVVMFELTGELEYVIPHMIAILVAKLVADSISSHGVYDLAQTVLGHPFLDLDKSLHLVRKTGHLVRRLIPPKQTMDELTVIVEKDNHVPRRTLESKLVRLKERGLMDSGLALVQHGYLQGYLAQGELEFGLNNLGRLFGSEERVRVLGDWGEDVVDSYGMQDVEGRVRQESTFVPAEGEVAEFNLAPFVDRTPMTMSEAAPIEYAVEAFGKLGLRHLIVTEEGTGKLKGVIIKKRMVQYLDSLH